jgi:hypothetical protein
LRGVSINCGAEETLRKASDGLFEVSDQAGAIVARYTDDRERAMATDGLGLLGLDHPLVASQLAKWRSTPPEHLGSSVRQGGGEPTVLCWWLFEASTAQGERKSQVLALEIGAGGGRSSAMERLPDRMLDCTSGDGFLLLPERRRFLVEFAEPALQRELQHRGLLAAGSSFSAELLG